MNISLILNLAHLPRLMAPGIGLLDRPDGGGQKMRLGLGLARCRAIMCAWGAGNVIFGYIWLTPVTFE